MSPAERILAVQQFGYTPREAAFVASAALHSGYFLRRQISCRYGKFADSVCKKVVARGHATPTRYPGNTHLYHLYSKPLYAALGQENNRHRRASDPLRLRLKIMGLDYVLLHKEYRFLPTEEDKLEYFRDERGLPEWVLPATDYSSKDRSEKTRRWFVDKFPIRVDQDGKVAFVYLDDGVFTPPGFHSWMAQYAALIRKVGGAEIIYAAASSMPFEKAKKQFATQFPESAGGVKDELLDYCEMRKGFETAGAAGRTQDELDRYRKLSRRFEGARFDEIYATWKVGEVLSKGDRKPSLSTFVLPFSYAMFGYPEATA